MRRIFYALLLLTVFAFVPAWAQTPQRTPVRTEKKPFQVTWLGHAAFEVVSAGGTRILIDPFIKDNPSTPAAFKNLSRYRPGAILVSHSHNDHAGDAIEIARTSGAVVVGASEFLAARGVPEKQRRGGNVGGAFVVGDVTIHLVPAVHSSEPSGRPFGFVLRFADGRSLYHTGDTWIFSDMSLIEELYHPDLILLCAGGGPFTQDAQTAQLAIEKYFDPETIIPMHYGTFPQLAKEEDVRAALGDDKRVQFMKPGETKPF